MLRRDDHERRAEDGVHTGREHGQRRIGSLQFIDDFRTFGTADPVALHGLDVLGPSGQRVEAVQQAVGVIRDLQVPLGEALLRDRRVAALAAAFHDLFVGQHRLAGRAPVDRVLFLIGQAVLVELDEDPLHPLVVVLFIGAHLSVPVIGETHLAQLLFHLRDVGAGPDGRMRVVLDGRVFRRQAERVESDGMQHVEAVHVQVSREYVRDGIVAHVTHMELARRIREHLQTIELLLVRILCHMKYVFVSPYLLPFGLDLLKVILTVHTMPL